MQSPNSSGVTPDHVIARARRELAEAHMEALVKAITDKCFDKCIRSPGKTLTTSEQNCIAKTMDRYQEVMGLVFSVLASKANTQ